MTKQLILQATMPVKEKHDLKAIYDENKKELVFKAYRDKKIVYRRIPYREFRIVVQAYFQIKFEELFTYGDKIDISVPLISGFLGIRKKVQTRAFHTLKDNVESKKQGKLVKYKVPILEDWYSVLIWRNKNFLFKRLRLVFSKKLNDYKKDFVASKGYDNIITSKI